MKQRIITGLIGGAGFLFLVYLGNIPYTLLIAILAALGYHELLKMNKSTLFSVEGIIGLLTVLLIILSQNLYLDSLKYLNTLTYLLITMFLYLILVVFSKNRVNFGDVGYYLLGSLYIGFGFSYMLSTRLGDNGLLLTLLILFTTWATDSGAYFMGKNFGKHKLWPEISPKKTIEGFFGGILFAVIVAFITNYFFDLTSANFIILLGILIAIIGQIGDLVESALKRSKNIKDSGKLLPGHGGVLDRFDSLLFIFPILQLLHIFQLF